MINKIKKLTLKGTIPYIYVVGGGLGLISSFILVLDNIKLLENPEATLSCNLNPIISCGSVISTSQASVFGFPNPIMGLMGFAVLITVGVALIAGAKFRKWFWLGLQAGVTAGVIFVLWLIYQSIFILGTLCPYCILAWSVIIPIFWYTTVYNLQEGRITLGGRLKNTQEIILKNRDFILFIWILAIIGLILQHFWYYWSTLV